jgi:hypothetical protein
VKGPRDPLVFRYFILYAVYDADGVASVRNAIIRAGAALDRIEHIESLEHELGKEAPKGGYARLIHFIDIGHSGGR